MTLRAKIGNIRFSVFYSEKGVALLKNKPDQLLSLDTYSPEKLLDTISKQFKCKNDAELSKAIATPASVISSVRRKLIPISAQNLLDFHDATGMSIKKLRKLTGDSRKFFS